jgi:general secretion pathway protein H
MTHPGLRANRNGFTLIEILVVVVIVAVMAGTVAISFTGADREQLLRTEAERLAMLLEMARQQAVQRNEEWGFFVDESSYGFAAYDEQLGEWVPWNKRPLSDATLDNIRLRLSVEEQIHLPGERSEDARPDLVFFSSGESQPFELWLQPNWETRDWRIASDGLSRIEAERSES